MGTERLGVVKNAEVGIQVYLGALRSVVVRECAILRGVYHVLAEDQKDLKVFILLVPFVFLIQFTFIGQACS